MDDQPRSVPISLQDARRNVGAYVDIRAKWPECVCTVDDNVAHAEWLRGAVGTKALVSRTAEPISQLWDRQAAHSLGRFIHRVVGSESTSKQVTHQRPRSGFSIPYKVGEYVPHLPLRTPGRLIPRRLVQGHDAVGELVPQASDLVWYLSGLHETDHYTGYWHRGELDPRPASTPVQ
jgi:hypothetical protein